MCSIARACQYTPSTTARLEPRERPHVANAIPRIQLARRLALGFVAFEKSRHEELPRQRRQAHAPGLAVVDDPIRLVGIDHFDHRARRRRIVDDGVVVFRLERLVYGQAHQRVAVGRREVRAVEQLLDREAMELRRHLRAAAEHAA